MDGYESEDKRYIFFKLKKSPIIIEVDNKNYPRSLKIIDRNSLSGFSFPDYIDIDYVYSNLNEKLDIYENAKNYFDKIYKN